MALRYRGRRALTCALLAGGAVVASTFPGHAQDQSAAGPETIVVTGSRIARHDADSVGPLTTLTTEDLKDTGEFDIGDILQKLPDAGVSYNANGTQGTSFGASSISLRYLADSDGDANRTLVLVDGHRWVDGTGPRGIRDFVDLNTIPIGIVGSIEVLQDGASAIYGADAIAGVVNIHTIQNLDGLELNARAGVSSHGDGQEYQGFVNYGAELPHGSIFLSASYVDDQPVLAQNRDLTKVSLTEAPNNLSTPTSSPQGLYILPGFSTSAKPITQNAGVTVATSAADYHIAALPGDYYNTDAQGVYDLGPSKRYGFYGRFTNDLSENLTFTVDALYNRRISNQLFSPTALSIGGTLGTDKGFAIAANQAYNPFGTGFTAGQAWNIQLYTNEVGNRNNVEDEDNYRFSANLQGKFDAFDHHFTWTLFGSYSQNDAKITEQGNIDLEHLDLALQSPTACAAVAGCIPVNIFGQMTKAMAQYITDTGHETDSTQLFDVTLDVNGDIGKLPGGPIGFAAGVEDRRVVGNDDPDAYINEVSTGSGLLPLPLTTPTTTGIMRTPTSDGSYQVQEAYVEFNLPFLADLPAMKSLEADVAERFSNYSTVGSRFTNKVGLGYRPVDDLLLRATFSQAFRAPSLIELYTGERQTNLAGSNTDPCNGGAAAHPSLPGCAGIPSTYNQNLYNAGTLPETIAGNPHLKPETAETFSYGVSWTPSWLQGMSLTSDYYQITLWNAISTPAAATALSLCATEAGPYCSVVQRDPVSGQVLDFLSAYENLDKIKTAGLDTTWRYNFDTSIGNWQTWLSATYLNYFTVVAPNPLGGAPIVTNAAGTSTGGTIPATARSTYPYWKAEGSVRWSQDALALIWRERFIGATHDGAAPVLPVVPVKNNIVDQVFYSDIQADYTVEKYNAVVTVGINNIFDQMPPASYANAPINFDMYTYDIMGRYFFVRLAKDF